MRKFHPDDVRSKWPEWRIRAEQRLLNSFARGCLTREQLVEQLNKLFTNQ